MYPYINRSRYQDTVYQYLQICQTVRRNGRPTRQVLGTLGRLDQLDPKRVDNLIRGLKRFGTASSRDGVPLEQADILEQRVLGPVLVARALWEELGLPKLIWQGQQGFSVERAVFRMVVNRLISPMSKLRLTEEWQAEVEWSEGELYSYDDYLRALDALHPQIQRIEEGLFAHLRTLFSLPLRLIFYDLTSTFFEGNGVCPLAEFGYSRDHRPDRRQIVLGLGLTQESFPITHHVFPGHTVDVSTVKQVSEELSSRFGLPGAILVMDRGGLSGKNVQAVEEAGLGYVMALRTRQHAQVPVAIRQAEAQGLKRTWNPEADWIVREVEPLGNVRHVVVYSAFRAIHDREVRVRRLKRAREKLNKLADQVVTGKVKSERKVIETATRILNGQKVTQLVWWEFHDGRFRWGLDGEQHRHQHRLDGFYVLVSNDAHLSTQEIVDAYRQLREVEEAFKVLKSLAKLRPMFHWTERRVVSHVFLCVLSFLLARVLEHRLRAAGQPMPAARALRVLGKIQACDQLWEGFKVTRMTRPDPEASAILQAVGLSDTPRILRTEPLPEPA